MNNKLLELTQIDALENVYYSIFKAVERKKRVKIENAVNLILASDIYAGEDLPGFARSTMDGFAVKSADTFGASKSSASYLDLIGEIKIGQTTDINLEEGQAARIPTGACLPGGADAVLMIEDTDFVSDKLIECHKAVAIKENVISKGEDLRADELIFKKGHCLRPQDIGTLAGCGILEVQVYEKLLIKILATGNEVVAPSDKPPKGKIRDINSYAISSMLIQEGYEASLEGIVRDNESDLKTAIKKALEHCDMLILSGGSSVGVEDLTIKAITDSGNVQKLIHGVAIKPGKPTILASVNNMPVIGLPGHPGSAMIVCRKIVMPLLQIISGKTGKDLSTKRIMAQIDRNISSDKGKEEYIRVAIKKENDNYIATPVMGKSGLVKTMIMADGLVKVEFGHEGLTKNSIVEVELF